MVSEWYSASLGNVVSQGGGFVQTGPFGSQLHASDYVEKGIPCIMPANLFGNRVSLDGIAQISIDDAERLSKHIVQIGDIVYSRRGDVTRNALISVGEAGMFCGTGCLLIRPGNAIDSQFLFYHLSTPPNKEWIVRHAIGATMPNLNTGILSEVPLRIPEPITQKAIAYVLGSLDDRIELNRRMNETLEAMAQALFKSWFVDFDPVIDNALAAGKEIPAELSEKAQDRAALGDKRQPLPEEIRTLFPDEFSYSDELDWIPKGWEVKPIDEIAHFQNGLALQKFRPENEDNFLPVVKIAQLKAGVASSDEKASPDINPSCIIDNGDVIFSWSGSLMVDLWCGGKAALNQHLFKVTSENCPKWFYHLWAKYHLAVFQKIAADKAVTMGHIKRSHLKEALCIVPNIDLEKFDLIGKLVLKQIDSRLECTTLGLLRDTLLPKLLSGEVRIPDAEKMVEELAL
jgi:type I restriction enzyme, S subunit